MLMEDFLAENCYLISALKANYEYIHSEMCQHFGLFMKNNLLDEYKAIQNYIYINLTIIENLERTLNSYNDLVQENYTNK